MELPRVRAVLVGCSMTVQSKDAAGRGLKVLLPPRGRGVCLGCGRGAGGGVEGAGVDRVADLVYGSDRHGRTKAHGKE